MKILSLFDGMSGAHVALDRAGVKVDNYCALEIDEYAINIAQKNYPDTVQLGSVTDFKSFGGADVDLLIGGSPCQDLSFAGKGKGFAGERSGLFWEYVRIKEEVNPKFFLLENVRMKQENLNVISLALGVEPICINSGLVSAQNRVRYYWTNIPFVGMPKDKGIVLKDILETGFTTERDKSHCLDSSYHKGGSVKYYLAKSRRQMVFSTDGLCHIADADLKGHDCLKRIYHEDGKAPTLNTCGGGNREPKVLVTCGAQRGRYLEGASGATKQVMELRKDKKTNTLTSVLKDNNVVAGEHEGGRYNIEDLTWRKLTPLECERLQTVPDGYTEGVSNTQRYKMLGNGFTVDVIAHLLSGLLVR